MSNWSDPSWKMRVGVNHVPAFQTSGRPFASGGITPLSISVLSTSLMLQDGFRLLMMAQAQ